ncbi:MAG: hydrogenase formation protein HypD [Fervidicoccaceae archaeon]
MLESALSEIRKIAEKLGKTKIMSFCGTHEHTIASSGLRAVLPGEVELIPGPGCPVCVTPASIVDEAIRLSLEGVEVITFGDAFRLPGKKWIKSDFPKSLMEAKQRGGYVRVIYSPLEAIINRSRESVFLAIGFETTVPATVSLLERKNNVKILSAHRLTPPVMKYTLEKHGRGGLRGIIAPGHVSAIVGAKAWEFLPRDYGIATVVSGFEPEDVLISILELLRMIERDAPSLKNTYKRVVKYEGNLEAQRAIEKWFEISDASWRGFGVIPNSGLVLREKWKDLDAMWQYGIRADRDSGSDNPPGCKCAEVTLGMSFPTSCPLFMKTCVPENPYGPCMVSTEGTCYIWARMLGRRS